jgi:hypothetical protein
MANSHGTATLRGDGELTGAALTRADQQMYAGAVLAPAA